MIDILNIAMCITTVVFGLFGFIAPRYTASVLDLTTTDTTMGLSEIRASVGGLFVVGGLAAIWLNAPIAFVMLGFCVAGAALGRLVSLAFDKPPVIKVLVYGLIEAAMAAGLFAGNLGQLHP